MLFVLKSPKYFEKIIKNRVVLFHRQIITCGRRRDDPQFLFCCLFWNRRNISKKSSKNNLRRFFLVYNPNQKTWIITRCLPRFYDNFRLATEKSEVLLHWCFILNSIEKIISFQYHSILITNWKYCYLYIIIALLQACFI